MTTTTKSDDKRKTFLTPTFRMSYPSLQKPRAPKSGGDPKYSLVMIFPKKFTDPAEQVLFDAIKAECSRVAMERWGSDRSKWPTTTVPDGNGGFNKINAIMSPWHDGAEKDQPGYGPEVVFANVSSKQQPGIIDAKKDVIGPDPQKVYGGVFARAKVTIYAYDNERKGVGLGLRNVQIVRDGEPLGGKSDPQDDFDAITPPSQGAAPVGAAPASGGGFGV
jgi:hypothetical protein